MTSMTRERLMKVAEAGKAMPGPTWRRVDCIVPGVGVQVWAVLVEFGPRFTIESIDPALVGAGNPPLFLTDGEAVGWLVAAINAAPIAVEVQATLDRLDAEEAAKTERARVEELIKAQATVEAAARRSAEQTVVQ